MRRRREYNSFVEAAVNIKGWKARQEVAVKRNSERDSKDADIAVRRFIHDRDKARGEYSAAIEKRDALAARIALDAGRLATCRAIRSRGGNTPAMMSGLLDSEKHAPLWLAEADAEVDRMRSALHDAQARHDAGMAAYAASLSGDAVEPEPEPEPVEPEPELEPVEEAPRGRGRPRKVAA